MVAEISKAADARARVHGQLDASRSAEKKGKDKKHKNRDAEVLTVEKGKAPH
jgi:hypothetical protein